MDCIGYFLHLYLPRSNGVGMENPRSGTFSQAAVELDLCEAPRCVCADPAHCGAPGNRRFVFKRCSDVTAREDANWVQRPAFVPGGNVHSISGRGAVGAVGRYGQHSQPVNRTHRENT